MSRAQPGQRGRHWAAILICALGSIALLSPPAQSEQRQPKLPWETPPQQPAQQPAQQQNQSQQIAGANQTCTAGASPGGAPIWDGEAAPDQKSTVGISYLDHNGQPSICTGVVIENDETSGRGTVLTAGHCSCGSAYKLRFGETFAALPGVPATGPHRFQHRTGSYDCRHPTVSQPGKDYAILHFKVDQLNAEVVTARIASPVTVRASALVPSSKMTVVGYGLTDTGGSQERRKALVPVFSWMCSEKWAYDTRGCRPFAEMLLARWADSTGRNVDTCNGDSGGPVFAEVVTGATCTSAGKLAVTRDQVLVAITSRAMWLYPNEVTTRCGGGGIYEIVARAPVIEWLESRGVKPLYMPTPPWPKE